MGLSLWTQVCWVCAGTIKRCFQLNCLSVPYQSLRFTQHYHHLRLYLSIFSLSTRKWIPESQRLYFTKTGVPLYFDHLYTFLLVLGSKWASCKYLTYNKTEWKIKTKAKTTKDSHELMRNGSDITNYSHQKHLSSPQKSPWVKDKSPLHMLYYAGIDWSVGGGRGTPWKKNHKAIKMNLEEEKKL
jgi:hypothetical protein